MTSHRNWSILPILILLSTIAVGCHSSETSGLGTQIRRYLEVKNNYAAAIQQSSGGVFSANHRLVPIPPFAEPYQPGTQLLKSDFRLLSRSCAPPRLPERDLPPVPELITGATFDFAVEGPEIIKVALPAEVQATINRNSLARLKFSDLKTKEASIEDLHRGANNPACRAILEQFIGREIISIDALISGKEIISSTTTVRASTVAKAAKFGGFEVIYDDGGGYQLSDSAIQPKFWIVSERTIARGSVLGLGSRDIDRAGITFENPRAPKGEITEALAEHLGKAGSRD